MSAVEFPTVRVSSTSLLAPISDWGARLVSPLGSSLLSKDGMIEIAGRVYWIFPLMIAAAFVAWKYGYLTGRVTPPSNSTEVPKLTTDAENNTKQGNVNPVNKPPEDLSGMSGDTPSDSNEDLDVALKASVHSILENMRKNLEGVLSSQHPQYQPFHDNLNQFQEEMLKLVEETPQGAGNRALEFQTNFGRMLFSEARHALSDEIQKLINTYSDQLMALSDNNQSMGAVTERIQRSTDIKKDLEHIRLQIQMLKLEASSLTAGRCEEQSKHIEFFLGMIEGTLQIANRLLLEQASAIYTNEILKQGWEITPVRSNGDCLLLSLSGNDADKAADLRNKLVKKLREEITTNPDAGLKWIIQSLMNDLEKLLGYPDWFKREIQTRGVDFIISEEPNEGWQAYLDALSQPGVFAGEPELSVLHELVEANIHVYQPKAPPFQKDEQGRIRVLDPSLADRHPESFVFSQSFYDEWINSHRLPEDQKFIPLRRYPDKPIYRDTTCVILRQDHYEILKPKK